MDAVLVERVRSAPGRIEVAAGEGLTAWTRRGQLWTRDEDGPARRVPMRSRVGYLEDVGYLVGGRPVAVVWDRQRRDLVLVSLRDGHRTALQLPARAGRGHSAALDHGRVVLVTEGARGAGTRSALWVARLRPDGGVRGLRRWRYGPPGAVVAKIVADSGWIGVDLNLPDRPSDEEEGDVGDRVESFVGTAGGRWRSIGTAHVSVSSTLDDIDTLGVLPGGRWVLIVRRFEGTNAGIRLVPTAGGNPRRLPADVHLLRPLYGGETDGGILDGAVDGAGRLVFVSAGAPAALDADPLYAGPELLPSMLRTTPLIGPVGPFS